MLKHLRYHLYILALITATACKNKQKATETAVPITPNTSNAAEQVQIPSETPVPSFPNIVQKIAQAVPKGFKIDLAAEGDLNGDGVADKALVLINTKDTTGARTSLILLKQGNAYHLNAISHTAVEPKYHKDGYEIYDYEAISIDRGKLTISMQATGPLGTMKSTYSFIENELILTNISTFNMGAGGQTEIKLDALKGIYEQTDINTMKEDMPSTTTTKKYNMAKVLFKDSKPTHLMSKAYNTVGN